MQKNTSSQASSSISNIGKSTSSYKFTRSFLKYGLVAVVGGTLIHLYNENRPRDEYHTVNPNTILYVRTSQISSNEANIAKYREPMFHSLMKKLEGHVPYNNRNRYLESIAPKYNFHDYVIALERASTDDNVIGIVLHVDSSTLGTAQTQELRNTLERFVNQNREKNKKICITQSDYFDSFSGYWLASVFPKIFFHPTGIYDMPSQNFRLFYTKDLLEKFGIQFEKFANGHKQGMNFATYRGTEEEFKTNSELQNELQDAKALRGDLLQQIESDVVRSRRRQLSVANLISDEKILDNRVSEILRRTLSSTAALKSGIVDAHAYQDEIFTKVIDQYMLNDSSASMLSNGKKVPAPYHIVPLEEYTHNKVLDQQKQIILNPLIETDLRKQAAMFPAEKRKQLQKSERMNIGVITFTDNITDQTTTQLLHKINKARDTDNLDAVVIRINTPGGDSITSDTIRHHVEQLKSSGKRVIVSMGNMATSGGYLMALPADKIVANPTSIVGSIGVLGSHFSITQKKLEEFGIRTKKVDMNDPRSDTFEPLSDTSRAEAKQLVDTIYEDFVTKVATARKMSDEQVRDVAEGRVFSGKQAHKIGLVDELGGLKEAIDVARLSDLDDLKSFKRPYVLHPIQPPSKSPFFTFTEQVKQWKQTIEKILNGTTSSL
jgi:protease-4